MIDHAAAHERIADLALEPGGLDGALGGGDAAAAPDRELVDHVATCERCQADVAAWRAVQDSLAGSLGASGGTRRPGDRRDLEPIEAGRDLRASILAAAAAEPRPGAAVAESGARAAGAAATPQPLIRLPGLGRFGSSGGQLFLGLAAALVVAVGGTLLLAGPTANLIRTVDEARALSGVLTAVDRVLADPTHRVVDLRTAEGRTGGTVALASRDLVVLSSSIAKPAAGSVYRCWLMNGTEEVPIGRMEFAGGTAYWVGSLDEWASVTLAPGTTFYVTLETDGAGGHSTGPAVLEAEL
jgi:anti-sigma-K factor RskA